MYVYTCWLCILGQHLCVYKSGISHSCKKKEWNTALYMDLKYVHELQHNAYGMISSALKQIKLLNKCVGGAGLWLNSQNASQAIHIRHQNYLCSIPNCRSWLQLPASTDSGKQQWWHRSWVAVTHVRGLLGSDCQFWSSSHCRHLHSEPLDSSAFSLSCSLSKTNFKNIYVHILMHSHILIFQWAR